jgi:hypothetical protein
LLSAYAGDFGGTGTVAVAMGKGTSHGVLSNFIKD